MLILDIHEILDILISVLIIGVLITLIVFGIRVIMNIGPLTKRVNKLLDDFDESIVELNKVTAEFNNSVKDINGKLQRLDAVFVVIEAVALNLSNFKNMFKSGKFTDSIKKKLTFKKGSAKNG